METGEKEDDRDNREHEEGKGRKKKAGSADEPAWQDVLVDILLSFLTQSSAALRTCVTAVWRAFCDDITAAGLKSITDVLTQGGSRPKEGEGSEDEEMEGEEEDGDDEGEDEEEGRAMILRAARTVMQWPTGAKRKPRGAAILKGAQWMTRPCSAWMTLSPLI